MSENNSGDEMDNLTRLVKFHQENQKYFTLNREMMDEALFETDGNVFHKYANIAESRAGRRQQNAD